MSERLSHPLQGLVLVIGPLVHESAVVELHRSLEVIEVIGAVFIFHHDPLLDALHISEEALNFIEDLLLDLPIAEGEGFHQLHLQRFLGFCERILGFVLVFNTTF